MSYPRDLDEVADVELAEELLRRARLREAGRCSYCRRPIAECLVKACLHQNNGVHCG